MASSVTRSTRRAEGRHQGSNSSNNDGNGGGGGGSSNNSAMRATRPTNSQQQEEISAVGGEATPGGLSKRAVDDDEDSEPESVKNTKRQRISTEIIPKNALVTSSEAGNKAPTAQLTKAKRQKQSSAVAKTAASSTTIANDTNSTNKNHGVDSDIVIDSATSSSANNRQRFKTDDQHLTKHQAKVVNGIKHELALLQPNPINAGTRQQGRKLRSQEASRFKSELAAYFPEYDEVIGNEEKEKHLLNFDTPIVVFDSNPPGPQQATSHTQHTGGTCCPVRGYGDSIFTNVCDAEYVNFGLLESKFDDQIVNDGLPDKIFQPIHRRAERVERSIRNTEKGRAQHERDRIVNLLDGLQGHDWLRVMGVSGVTETKKREFQPARMHFIRGCQNILDKFRNWTLEEKRRKMEKEKAKAEEDEDGDESEAEAEDDDQEEDDAGDDHEGDRSQTDEGDNDDDENSEAGTSESSSSPAKQLHEEAMARSQIASKPKTRIRIRTRAPAQAIQLLEPPQPAKEFRSFFEKPQDRETALHSHHRRVSKVEKTKVMAWGHPIADMPEREDFMLPEEFRDEETLRVRARRKRIERRRSRGLG